MSVRRLIDFLRNRRRDLQTIVKNLSSKYRFIKDISISTRDGILILGEDVEENYRTLSFILQDLKPCIRENNSYIRVIKISQFDNYLLCYGYDYGLVMFAKFTEESNIDDAKKFLNELFDEINKVI